MNLAILHKEVQAFISNNLHNDIAKLILKGSPFATVSVQELAEQIIAKKKAEKKLPSWFQTKNIYYPNKLNIEQASSEITANYKANLVTGESIIDITGGFGVDCLAFSKKCKQVVHCEIDENLSKLVAHNCKQLKVNNIQAVCDDGINYLNKKQQKYDAIYVDPSRRDSLKKRVFLLEDCSPDLSVDLLGLFTYTSLILVKTAPILDIASAIDSLKFVKDIHVIAVNNEVKEVLYLLHKNYTGQVNYKTINFSKKGKQIFDFICTTDECNYSLPKKYLYEPNSAILKAGSFQEVGINLNLEKLHKHSHLYTSNELIEFPGRVFNIMHIKAYKAKNKTKLGIKKANITTRNFPETVAEIRKKTKIKEGGNMYLFFTTNCKDEKIILVCEKR